MPRPKKCRMISYFPHNTRFFPEYLSQSNEIIMTLDEYETIKLIDYQDLTQEECASYMHVARTTVQQIYNSARKKLSLMLIEGKSLSIEDRNYCVCNNSGLRHGCRHGHNG